MSMNGYARCARPTGISCGSWPGSRRATAAPIPLPPPVTRALRPAREIRSARDREDTFASLRAAFGWVPVHDGAYARAWEVHGELGSSHAFVERLVKVFLDDNATLLDRIESALSARNYQEFRALVHATKGSSASMGTERLTRLCDGLGRLSDAELRLQPAADP